MTKTSAPSSLNDLNTSSRVNTSVRMNWSINWHLLASNEKTNPKEIFQILGSQTLNDRELFQSVVRRDWEAALRYTKRLKIKLSSIHAERATDKADQLENALIDFKKDERAFSKAKLLRVRENISSKEVEIAKAFVDLIDELREVIIDIEDYIDEGFPAGDCSVYITEVERMFITGGSTNDLDAKCSSCRIF